MRVEVYWILKYMLKEDEAKTNAAIADGMGLTLENTHRRTKKMLEDKYLARELRYVAYTAGRTRVFYLWVTSTGIAALTAYESNKRNFIRKPAPTKAPTRPKVASQHVPNSIFDLARTI